jgi:exocyst complex component 7
MSNTQRVKDDRVALLTIDVVRAVKLISPFDSAYKSVSKRRQLPWDPNMGKEAGDLDTFIRFLVMRLVNSLMGKALNYTKHAGDIGQARSSMFMLNNTLYLRDELGPKISFYQGRTIILPYQYQEKGKETKSKCYRPYC